MGTLHEFVTAFEAHKPIGVLTGAGGVGEQVNELMQAAGLCGDGVCSGKHDVLLNPNIDVLLDGIIKLLDEKPKKQTTVTVLGTATLDSFLFSPVFKPVCKDKVCYEHLILGKKYDIEKMIQVTGGNCTNVAVTLSRFGIKNVSMVAVLGDDPAGKAVVSELISEGVDLSEEADE